MNRNKAAVAVALLAGVVIGLSVWVSSRTEPLVSPADTKVPAAESGVSTWEAQSLVAKSSTDGFADRSVDLSAETVDVSSSTSSPVSEPEEPVFGTMGASDAIALTVVVTDAEGNPLKGASVSIGGQEGKTDENGLFLAELETCDTALHVASVGYVSYYDEVELTGVARKFTVALEAADTIRGLLDSAELRPYQTNVPELEQYLDNLFYALFEPGMDTYDRVKVCYDWLIEHTIYRNVSHWKPGYWERAYQALVTGRGTCYDYSVAFVAMMRHLGLECYLVEGSTAANRGGMTGHYWTIVQINGKTYIFDPQVEDSIAGRTSSKEITYLRFCLLEPNGKYVYSVRSRSRCMSLFDSYLQENGVFLDPIPDDPAPVDDPQPGDDRNTDASNVLFGGTN